MDILKKKNGNKYLVSDSTDKKDVLQKYTKLWDGIKNLIQEVDNKSSEYGKDFMKIKYNSEDKLPLNKELKLYNLAVVRYVCEDDKYYPQVF